jgi:hypothetical protein
MPDDDGAPPMAAVAQAVVATLTSQPGEWVDVDDLIRATRAHCPRARRRAVRKVAAQLARDGKVEAVVRQPDPDVAGLAARPAFRWVGP